MHLCVPKALALEDVVEEPRPFADPNFEEYLRWYVPYTRTRVTYIHPRYCPASHRFDYGGLPGPLGRGHCISGMCN